jgi:FKBP-type peptidyl-prolyl cis-trans isomerase FkpA
MKKTTLAFILLVTLSFSCSKKDDVCNLSDVNIVAPVNEIADVKAYVSTTGLTDTIKHSSGFYYRITQAGTGKSVVNLCSVVTVKYAGRFTNGTYFDPLTPGTTSLASFRLGDVIPGWQKGVPLISSGGKITLFIPPTLAYGAAGRQGIPPNSILIFDIELVSVQ